MKPVELPAGAVLRPIGLADAAALLEAQSRNRHRLRRSSPQRPESFWTLDGQRERVETEVRRNADGESFACVIARGEAILGMLTLSSIVRGPFCNASVGYWIDEGEQGRGLMSAAVAAACHVAEAELGLHRVEASTMPDNAASQRVLAKNGFEQIGRARDYLYLDGAWQEALLFQRILHDRPPPVS